ncbi:unnamed protein product [Notodromas monacha]|uniref:Bromo domain-containing protein n=1 Tax=Notodromas monacha TaxID=399045 RepID=A0A7R9BG59_9CRUS|nr:unnamed protein product [Notodromas monacha]CAG0913547.1 unnamed protein product [Notodromas monacha]
MTGSEEERMEVDEDEHQTDNDGVVKKSKKKKKKKDKKHRHKDKDRKNKDEVPNSSTASRDAKLLNAVASKLLSMFELKDERKFFAWPVTDQIAPGYSAIIARPMDFATMRGKIRSGKYTSLKNFKEDFELVCTNAQTYNQPSTVYYKAAKRLQHYGKKAMHSSRILDLKSECPEFEDLTYDDLARDFQPSVEPAAAADNKEKSNDEDTDPEKILETATSALKGVHAKLAMRKADSSLGFLRQRPDGTTTLNIIVPPMKTVDTKEKIVTLGTSVGKLTHGTGSIQGFKEDRRNVAKIGKPMSYGPYNTHAPLYDTTFASVNAEEANLLLSACGSELGVSYAESLRRFCADSEYCLNLANDVIDAITGGAYSDARVVIGIREDGLTKVDQKIRSSVSPQGSAETPQIGSKMDFESLKSLENDGIDVSFLDEMEKEDNLRADMSKKLMSAGKLLEDLKESQDKRLSLPPPQHLLNCPPPSQDEILLARNVVTSLTDISKQVPPACVAPVTGLRKAMGIVPSAH